MNKYDDFIEKQAQPMLAQHERVIASGFVQKKPNLFWQFMMKNLLRRLFTTSYYAVVTSERLLLIRTSMGFFSPKLKNYGTEAIELKSVQGIKLGGLHKNRSITLQFADGKRRVLWLHPEASMVSGQAQLWTELTTRWSTPALTSKAA